jgi:transcription termination factor NusB
VADCTIYNKLRAIFPEVKSSYIKEICLNAPIPINYNNTENVLNTLIDHLLNNGCYHLNPIQNNFIQETVTSLSVDEQYEYLIGIFPDADPTYLREFVENIDNTKQSLETFIQQNLEKRNYPTKEEYLAKIKITQQQKQYTTDFRVENFLEIFSNPFVYFEDKTRQCIYQPIAMEFLKSYFNKTKVYNIYL